MNENNFYTFYYPKGRLIFLSLICLPLVLLYVGVIVGTILREHSIPWAPLIIGLIIWGLPMITLYKSIRRLIVAFSGNPAYIVYPDRIECYKPFGKMETIKMEDIDDMKLDTEQAIPPFNSLTYRKIKITYKTESEQGKILKKSETVPAYRLDEEEETVIDKFFSTYNDFYVTLHGQVSNNANDC